MKFGVVRFPGSNCDGDCFYVLEAAFHQQVEYIWHQETKLKGFDCVILPGGFSYGDYLRAGAIARFSPVMAAVESFASNGGLVFGICNGFQILAEAGLLPGALLTNDNLQFRCQWVHVRVEQTDIPYTSACKKGQVLHIPIAHKEGRYFADEKTLQEMEARGQIVLRYCTAEGRVVGEANPNGSLQNIAGICNVGGNVFAMMPHPERCCEPLLGGVDGRFIFESILGLQSRARKGPIKGERG